MKILVSFVLLFQWLSATEIRILNKTHFDIKRVYVGQKYYGDIKNGKISKYQTWPKAYGYAYVSLLIKNKKNKITPTDFVGEKPLGKGKFTYIITYVDKNLDIHAQKD